MRTTDDAERKKELTKRKEKKKKIVKHLNLDFILLFSACQLP
jgi:hypothetical protein